MLNTNISIPYPIISTTGLSGLPAEVQRAHPLTSQPCYQHNGITKTNTIIAPPKPRDLATKLNQFISYANVIPHKAQACLQHKHIVYKGGGGDSFVACLGHLTTINERGSQSRRSTEFPRCRWAAVSVKCEEHTRRSHIYNTILVLYWTPPTFGRSLRVFKGWPGAFIRKYYTTCT